MEHLKRNISVIVCLIAFLPLGAQVYINEISICNISKDLDPKNDYRGWIELYNASSAHIEMRDLYFSDESGVPQKYKLSSARTLPAGGFAVVWLNDEVGNVTTGYALDTDADDGGYLSVADKNGMVLDALDYPVQYTNTSYGRTKDGDQNAPLGYFVKSTCAASNHGVPISDLRVESPVFSLQGGFYSGTVSVQLSCATSGAQIYYTTDYSEPTEKSLLYTGKLTFDQTTVLRAKAYKEGCLEGAPSTSTYMINEREPDLPVAFVTLDEVSLYSDELGIYTVGKDPTAPNYEKNWTRSGHFEFLDAHKERRLDQPIGYEISGNVASSYAQKSFKVKSGTKYGKKRLDYQVFPQRGGRRYKSILLRNGGQPYVGLAIVRDAVLQEMAGVTPLIYQAYRACVVYLNGQYWGIYNLRERNSQDNLYTNYGLKESDMDLIDNLWIPKAKVGSLASYEQLEEFVKGNDMSKAEHYQQFSQRVDVDNYLYYMAIEILLGNDDWPDNNQRLFFSRVGSTHKWRWILQDLDNTLKESSFDGLTRLFESTSTKLSTKMICYLLANTKFANRYIDIQSLVTGSVYRPGRVEESMQKAYQAIQTEYPYAFEKWPETMKEEPEKEIASMLKNLKGLCEAAYHHLSTRFALGTVYDLTVTSNHTNIAIAFNEEVIPLLPYVGKYFSGRELKLTAPWYDKEEQFAYWEVNNRYTVTKVESTTLTLKQSEGVQVKAIYKPVEKSRRSGLYINEVSAANGIFVDQNYKVEDWIEVYNSSAWPIDLSGYYLSNSRTDAQLFQFPENSEETLVPACGRVIVWCSKKPERGALHTNFKLAKEGGHLSLTKRMKDGAMWWVDSISYIAHDEYESLGRYPDGAENIVLFDYPTFNAPNQYSSYNTVSYVETYEVVTDLSSPSADESDAFVYQNPDHTVLFIENCERANYTFLSMDGKVLQQGIWIAAQGIDIGMLESGAYLILLQRENSMQVLRFIK